MVGIYLVSMIRGRPYTGSKFRVLYMTLSIDNPEGVATTSIWKKNVPENYG